MPTEDLVPLPSQPPGVSWPTATWATGEQLTGDPDRVEDLLAESFDHNPNERLALTLAVVIVQGGRIVAEAYGPRTDSRTTLISWSMAKSVTDVAYGLLVGDRAIDLDAPAAVPEWAEDGDPRAAITVRDLLRMRSGLEFNEDYVDAETSHCIEMLFGVGADDVAGYAASQGLLHPPGTVYNYASGTTCILARLLCDVLRGGPGGSPEERQDAVVRFLRERLFDPLGMTSAQPRFDAAGTWVGSSYLYATARDFARFGLFALRDGVWDGDRLLPEGWMDAARRPVSTAEENGFGYGEQWWTADPRIPADLGAFWANGYEGQRIMCVPALDLVVVRLGKTPEQHRDALLGWYREVVAAFVD